jgi:hypothetical protein
MGMLNIWFRRWWWFRAQAQSLLVLSGTANQGFEVEQETLIVGSPYPGGGGGAGAMVMRLLESSTLQELAVLVLQVSITGSLLTYAGGGGAAFNAGTPGSAGGQVAVVARR